MLRSFTKEKRKEIFFGVCETLTIYRSNLHGMEVGKGKE
jgi:hypothetical protein